MNFSDFCACYAISVLSYLLSRILGTVLDRHPPRSHFFKILSDGAVYSFLVVGLFGWLTVGAVEQFCYKRSDAYHIVKKYLDEEDRKKELDALK